MSDRDQKTKSKGIHPPPINPPRSTFFPLLHHTMDKARKGGKFIRNIFSQIPEGVFNISTRQPLKRVKAILAPNNPMPESLRLKGQMPKPKPTILCLESLNSQFLRLLTSVSSYQFYPLPSSTPSHRKLHISFSQ